MAIVVLDCPHCDARKMTFQVIAQHRVGEVADHVSHKFNVEHAVACVCSGCQGGVFLHVLCDNQGLDLNGPKNLDALIKKRLGKYPAARRKRELDHLPENIGEFYDQAEDNVRRGNWDAAGLMARKTVETALAAIDPESAELKLYDRIDAVAKAGQITKDLGVWAHQVRIGGNEAGHEEETYDRVEATELVRFAELFLLYVFTLPGMLEDRKSRRDGGEGCGELETDGDPSRTGGIISGE